MAATSSYDKLREALEKGDTAKLQAALAAGAPVNARYHDLGGRTPLMLAVQRHSEPLLKVLLRQPGLDQSIADNAGLTALLHAVWLDWYEGITALIAAGAPLGVCPRLGIGPLHLACRLNREAAARLLLQAGADPAEQAAGGWDALRYARLHGDTPLVQLLTLPQEDAAG